MRRITIIACSVILLHGCGIYKPYSRPDSIRTDSLFGARYETADTTTIADMGWRELFTDPYLRDLIERGLAGNTDLQAARLRVEEAETTLRSARLAYLPSFNLAPSGGIASFDGAAGSWTYNVPVATSWEIDIFGRLTNAKRQARTLYEQSEDYRQAVATGLVSAIATQYYTLLMLDSQLRISRDMAEQFRESVRVMRAMKSAGMANQIGVSQMEAAYYAVESGIEDLKRSINEVENSLSRTLGTVPGPIGRGTLEGQTFPSDLRAGVPLQLLANRPDVRAAEKSLASAYYATNAARASLYPSITLSGTAGWTNSLGMAIVNPGKLLLSAAGSLAQPIFNAGYNRGRVKIARAQQEEARLAFQQTLLDAGAEVNDALTKYQTADAKRVWRTSQVEALELAVRQSELLMSHTSTTYLDVLTAKKSLLEAQLSQAADTFEQIQAVIDLYHALGGGVE